VANLYLNLLVLNVTIAGIALAALLALHQMAVGISGDEAAALVWRGRGVRASLVWMGINAALCLAASVASSVSHDLLPRWDPGIDYILEIWPAAIVAAVSSSAAWLIAVRAIYGASRLASPVTASKVLSASWTLVDFSQSSPGRNVEGAREVAIRAIHRSRPRDCDEMLRIATASIRALLHATDDVETRGAAFGAFRDSYLLPVAEEAIRIQRPDQAATASRNAMTLAHIPMSRRGGPHDSVFDLCRQVLDLVLPEPDAKRALTSVIEDIFRQAMQSAEAGRHGDFFDACWALLPVAKSDPKPLLTRNGVVDVGGPEAANRPIERLIMRLEDLETAIWKPGDRHDIAPGPWLEVAEAQGHGLSEWIKSGKGLNPDIEELLVRDLFTIGQLAIHETLNGHGGHALEAMEAIERVARVASRSVNFERTTREATKHLAHAGLITEESGLEVRGQALAARAAALVVALGRGEAEFLKSEIPKTGEFAYERGAERRFVGRLE
jgi:hypothetical protein